MSSPHAPALPATDASSTHDDAAPPPVELVTVDHRFHPLEAELLRGCLEAHGIPAVLGDVQTVQTDMLLSAALGGIRVRVPAPLADDARRLIERYEAGELAIGEDDAPPPAAGDARDAQAGPGSDIGMPRGALGWTVLLVGLGLAVAMCSPMHGLR